MEKHHYGLITGNTTYGAYGGGGVQVFGGIFTMTSGLIDTNSAHDDGANYAGVGGGVAIHNQGITHDAIFSMSDTAVIRGNHAVEGGGVAVTYNATFMMEGGTILENVAAEEGGGVFVSQGLLYMTDGAIESNTATSGGGVGMFYEATFNMDGGNISDNTATENGGGVWIWAESFFTMSNDAEISDNNAVNGGAIYLHSDEYGGFLYLADSLFTLTGGTVARNIAEENGGGVFVEADNQFYIIDGSITENIAGANGGGVYVETDGKFEMTGGAITDNTAANDGGGIFTQDYDYNDPVPLTAYANILMEDGTISGNTAGGGYFFPPSNADEFAFGNLLNNYQINFRGAHATQITFVLNGGNVSNNTSDIVHSVPVGETIGDLDVRPTPVRPGHVLIGWTLGDDPAILSTGDVDALPVTSGMIFTAQWRQVNGGNIGGGGNGGGSHGSGGNGSGDTSFLHEWFMMGYPNGTFRPNGSITRAEVAAMLTRTMIPSYAPDLPAPIGSSFSDVSTDQWFHSYVAWAYAHDIILGYTDGTFRPNEPITRQELAAMIVRASGTATLPAGNFPFPDENQIQAWARDHVYTAYQSGWMIGDAGTLTLRPLETISRAETAAVFFRVLERGVTNMDSIQPVFDALRIFPDASNQNSWFFFYVVEASHTHRYTMQDGEERWSAILWPNQD